MGSCKNMARMRKDELALVLLQISGCFCRFGPSGSIEYREGNIGIVIAVPHGGEWNNLDIPSRTFGISEGDDHTKELSEAVASSICTSIGKCPHMIITHLKRSKMDPNREIIEAAQGNPKAEEAWRDYHGFIDEAKQKERVGVVIDLHGQSHRRNSTELGYLLSSAQLNRGDFNSALSSVKQLARSSGRSGKDVMVLEV